MVSPMLSTIRVNNDAKNVSDDVNMTDQEDEIHSVVDLNLLYGKDEEEGLNFVKQDKETVKQILIDVKDISMHEYSMHYVLHSENEYLAAYKDLISKIKDEIFSFHKKLLESIPYRLWNEVVSEHTKILSNFLPVSVLKEVYEYRFYFARKYTKNRIKCNLEKYNKQLKEKKKQQAEEMRVFSTNSYTADPTTLTENEYLEITVAEYLNTPFYELLSSSLKSDRIPDKSKLIRLMAFLKDKEVEVIKIYNENFEIHKKFTSEKEFKNSTIERYKISKGFPLKLGVYESKLYAIEDGIDRSLIEKIYKEKQQEKEKKEQLKVKQNELQTNLVFDTDSNDEAGNIFLGTMRLSSPEKREEGFIEPLGDIMKNLIQTNIEDMEVESNEEEKHLEVPKLGRMSSYLNKNFRHRNTVKSKNPFESSPFDQAEQTNLDSELGRKSN